MISIEPHAVRSLSVLLLCSVLALPGCQLASPFTGTSSADEVDAYATMQRYVIDQAAHPEAVCNDGSTPVFYHRRGVGDGAGKWVVWFKGGGACWDQATCGSRAPSLMSARPWMTDALQELTSKGNEGSQDGKAGGILDPDPAVNPDFHNWNHVYLVYCSSDNWAGTGSATAGGRTIHFRGHYIADAMIDALQDARIMGTPTLSEATHILLTGSSAGGSGLRNNLDRLAGRLSFADVRGVSDAGLGPSVTPEEQAIEHRVLQQKFDRWQARPDASCEAAAGGEPWRCLSGIHLLEDGHLSTPAFHHQDQRDPVAFFGVSEQAGAAIRALLAPLPGAFSPSDGFHIILNDPRFNAQEIDGHTMADVLGNWYFGRPGPTNLIEGDEGAP